jgi:hypothetical protein
MHRRPKLDADELKGNPMDNALLLAAAILMALILVAHADDLDDAYAACQPHRHLTDPHIGVTWDKGFEHCDVDEAFYAGRKEAPPADKDKHLTNWLFFNKLLVAPPARPLDAPSAPPPRPLVDSPSGVK